MEKGAQTLFFTYCSTHTPMVSFIILGTTMYLEPLPSGLNPLSDADRQPIWHVTSGDEMLLTTKLSVPGHPEMAATPQNSRAVFSLAETQFDRHPIWSCDWHDGIVQAIGRLGLVTIRIPETITERLRRGSYRFAVSVADAFGRHRETVLSGTLLLEYSPGGPQHSIPYSRPRECEPEPIRPPPATEFYLKA